MSPPVDPLAFRLLGPVEVVFNGSPVEFTRPQHKDLLGLFLLHPNQLLTLEQLTEGMWGKKAPTTARVQVQNIVSALRAVLTSAAGSYGTIHRRRSGYMLAIDEALIDTVIFERTVTGARSATDMDSAAERYRSALSLWRARPFADVQAAYAEDARPRLEELRICAVEALFDIELALGHHTELVSELTAELANHPFRERLTGQLMIALYRCGRQTEALHIFGQARRRLVEEHGLEPSIELQTLQRQVLASDPGLDLPQPRESTSDVVTLGSVPNAGGSPSVVPRQLPALVRHFVGRTAELKYLTALADRAVTEGPAVIATISGTGGIGKTTLALHWAHQVTDCFPDGQLYANLRGFDPDATPLDPSDAVRAFLDALDVPPERIPSDLDGQSALYRSLLAGRRMLIVLDNASDAEQVRPLLPSASGCLAVVTSRDQLAGLAILDGAQPFSLDLLSTVESQQLVARRLGEDRVQAEPDAVAEIIARCARLPLALAIVTARAALHPHVSLASIAHELRELHSGLDAFHGDDQTANLRAIFSWSYRRVSGASGRLFRLLGLHPGPDISTAAAASLAAVSITDARRLLGELTRAHLVTEHTLGRYTFHDLLRVYAAELAGTIETHDEARAATHRMFDHYVHTARGAAALLSCREPITLPPAAQGVAAEELTDRAQALDWFDTEHPVLLAAINQAAATGLDTHTWQLVWVVNVFLDRRGYWHDYVAIQHTALAAVKRLGDQRREAYLRRVLGDGYTWLRRFDDARTQLTLALDLCAQFGDPAGQARTHGILVRLCLSQGRPTEALNHAKQCPDLFRSAGDRIGQASAFNNIGWTYALLGEYEQALVHCQRALALQQEVGNREYQAGTWDSLGYAHHHLGHHRQALDCYHHAIDLYRDLGDRYFEADALAHLGETHRALGNLHAARQAWQQALGILDELGHPNADELRDKLRLIATRPAPAREDTLEKRT